MASGRVFASGRSSQAQWEDPLTRHKSEIAVQEKDGRRILVRLVEFE